MLLSETMVLSIDEANVPQEELEREGIWDFDRLSKPYIRCHLLQVIIKLSFPLWILVSSEMLHDDAIHVKVSDQRIVVKISHLDMFETQYNVTFISRNFLGKGTKKWLRHF